MKITAQGVRLAFPFVQLTALSQYLMINMSFLSFHLYKFVTMNARVVRSVLVSALK